MALVRGKTSVVDGIESSYHRFQWPKYPFVHKRILITVNSGQLTLSESMELLPGWCEHNELERGIESSDFRFHPPNSLKLGIPSQKPRRAVEKQCRLCFQLREQSINRLVGSVECPVFHVKNEGPR